MCLQMEEVKVVQQYSLTNLAAIKMSYNDEEFQSKHSYDSELTITDDEEAPASVFGMWYIRSVTYEAIL